jgi:hypothetical protein
MKPNESLPDTQGTPVIRTDFGDDAAWEMICGLFRQPTIDSGHEFFAYVSFVENPQFGGFSAQELLTITPRDYRHSFVFVADREAMQRPEFPILVVDLLAEPGRTFRAILSETHGIENNLSIANMDFCEFADNVDADGVFRGFKMT